MSHTYTSLHYHCVFSTSGRRNLIFSELRPRLHAYIGGIVKNIRGVPISVGGMADHVHIVMSLPAGTPVAGAVRDIKANSSGWVRETFPGSNFAWQEGYGAFTVSRSRLDATAQYVANQEEHHKGMSFEDELRALLKKHGIEFEEKYLLD